MPFVIYWWCCRCHCYSESPHINNIILYHYCRMCMINAIILFSSSGGRRRKAISFDSLSLVFHSSPCVTISHNNIYYILHTYERIMWNCFLFFNFSNIFTTIDEYHCYLRTCLIYFIIYNNIRPGPRQQPIVSTIIIVISEYLLIEAIIYSCFWVMKCHT